MLERLKKSLLEAPVFKRGEYNYFIHPITDGVPEVRPELIREVTGHIVRIADMDVDKMKKAARKRPFLLRWEILHYFSIIIFLVSTASPAFKR